MVDAPENIGLVRGMLGLRLWNKHDDNDQSNAIEYTRSDLVAELAAENERLKEKEAHRIKVIRENENLLYSNIELRRKIEALASTGAVKANLDTLEAIFWRRGVYGERSACRRMAQEVLSALDTHPRATNTVDAHETANVSDKPEGQQEPVSNEPVTNHWPEAHEVADILAENKGFWRACSGCHETNEGHPTGPWSMILGCNLGHGCHECGGIGAVWDTTDYADMGDYLAQEFTRPSERAVTEAAGPFITFANHAVEKTDDGWVWRTSSNERICDWFGPSDFAALKAAMEAGRRALATKEAGDE